MATTDEVIDEIWARLDPATRAWLVAHNGEPLSDEVARAVVDAAGGRTDPSWWAGGSRDGGTQLTDAAVDRIEALANGE